MAWAESLIDSEPPGILKRAGSKLLVLGGFRFRIRVWGLGFGVWGLGFRVKV